MCARHDSMGLCVWHDGQAARRKTVLEMQVGPAMGHKPLADRKLCPGLCHGSREPSPSHGYPLHKDLVVAVGGTEGQTGERFTRKDREDFLTN